MGRRGYGFFAAAGIGFPGFFGAAAGAILALVAGLDAIRHLAVEFMDEYNRITLPCGKSKGLLPCPRIAPDGIAVLWDDLVRPGRL